MIGEFELFHGAVLREIIVANSKPICVEADDNAGRVNTFLINQKAIVYIKHSTKRLPPWQFTFNDDSLEEIEVKNSLGYSVWLVHVCGRDGFVAINYEEFRAINPVGAMTTPFVRVDRDRNTMYRVNGTGGKLGRLKPRGLNAVISGL